MHLSVVGSAGSWRMRLACECTGSWRMRLSCLRVRLHSDQRYIRFTYSKKFLSAPGRREQRQAQRCRCDVVGQTSPFLGSQSEEVAKKYITGITTGIE
jgi:hypothetical protein